MEKLKADIPREIDEEPDRIRRRFEVQTVRRPLDAGDRTIYTHNLWLNYLKPVSLGLVVSPGALRVAQVDLPLQAPEAQNALLDLTVAKAVPEDEDPDASVSTRILPDLRAFLTDFLGWKPDLLELYRSGPNARMFAGQEKASRPDDLPEAPEAIRHQLTQYDNTLEPSFAYRWPKAPEDGSRYALLGLAVPGGVDLDRKLPPSSTGSSRRSSRSTGRSSSPRSSWESRS